MLERLLDHLAKEGAVLRQAPAAFVTLGVICGVLGFTGGIAWRGQEVAVLENLVRVKDAERELSDRQLSDIKTSLKANPSFVDIISGSKSDKADPRVDQFKSAFKDSGWDVGSIQASSGSNLVLRTQDPKAAMTIEDALKGAGVHYETSVPPGKSGTDFLLNGTNK